MKDLQMTPDPRRKRTDVNACRFNPNYKVSPPYSLLPSPDSIQYIMFIRCMSLHVAPLPHVRREEENNCLPESHGNVKFI